MGRIWTARFLLPDDDTAFDAWTCLPIRLWPHDARDHVGVVRAAEFRYLDGADAGCVGVGDEEREFEPVGGD